mmetsp:Transcript_20241/g.32796  ORF Transcript_20241/g.32796 Transcript_20241/m.32796 type:complete len:331 (-) Transcript_20241:96-1088(-)
MMLNTKAPSPVGSGQHPGRTTGKPSEEEEETDNEGEEQGGWYTPDSAATPVMVPVLARTVPAAGVPTRRLDKVPVRAARGSESRNTLQGRAGAVAVALPVRGASCAFCWFCFESFSPSAAGCLPLMYSGAPASSSSSFCSLRAPSSIASSSATKARGDARLCRDSPEPSTKCTLQRWGDDTPGAIDGGGDSGDARLCVPTWQCALIYAALQLVSQCPESPLPIAVARNSCSAHRLSLSCRARRTIDATGHDRCTNAAPLPAGPSCSPCPSSSSRLPASWSSLSASVSSSATPAPSMSTVFAICVTRVMKCVRGDVPKGSGFRVAAVRVWA